MRLRKDLIIANTLLLNIVLGAGLVTSLLSVYLSQIGISLGGIGLIFAFGSIAAGFLRLPLGPCIDFLGKRNFVILGALGYPIFAIGITLAKTTPQFIGLDILLELFAAIFWTAFSAHYFDIIRKGKEGIEMAGRNIIHYSAVAATPFLAGIIADRFGFTNLFYIGALISAIGIPIAVTSIKTKVKNNNAAVCLASFKEEYANILKIKGFKTIFAVLFLNTFTWTFWAIYMPIYLSEAGFQYAQIGLLITAIWIVGTLIQWPLGKVIDKVPAKYLLIPGFALVFLGSLIFFWMRNYFSYLTGRIVAGVGWDVSYWPAVGLFAKNTPKEEHGAGWAALMAGVAWAYGIGALVGGFLTQRFGIEKILWASAILAFATGIALISSKVLGEKGHRHLKEHQVRHHHIRKIQ